MARSPVNRTSGLKIAADGLKGRVFEVSLADLNQDESSHRKIRLVAEDIQGKSLLTNFHGAFISPDTRVLTSSHGLHWSYQTVTP